MNESITKAAGEFSHLGCAIAPNQAESWCSRVADALLRCSSLIIDWHATSRMLGLYFQCCCICDNVHIEKASQFA